MNNLIQFFQTKKDIIDLWIINSAILTISLSDLPIIIGSISGLLTIAYTIWRWRKEIKNKK